MIILLRNGCSEFTVALAVLGVLTEANELLANYLDTVIIIMFFLFFNT